MPAKLKNKVAKDQLPKPKTRSKKTPEERRLAKNASSRKRYANMTSDQRERKRACGRDHMRRVRASQTPEQREAENKKNRERVARYTPEQKQAAKDYCRNYRENMSREQRDIYNARARDRRASMSPDQKEDYKKYCRIRGQERRDNMSPEEREKYREYIRRRHENMTPEQRERIAEYNRNRLASLSPEELRHRREKDRIRTREWFAKLTPEKRKEIKEREFELRADIREKKHGVRRLLTPEERSAIAKEVRSRPELMQKQRESALQQVKDIEREDCLIVITRHRIDGRIKVGLAKDAIKRYRSTNWEVLQYAWIQATGLVEAVCHVRTGCRTSTGMEEGNYDPRNMDLDEAFDVVECGGYWQSYSKDSGYTEATDRWTLDETIAIVEHTAFEIEGEFPDWQYPEKK